MRVTRPALISLFLVLGLQGCIFVNDDDDEVNREELVVQWSIDGSDAVALCDDLDIEFWRVKISGPESDTIDIACDDDWSTINLGRLDGSGALEIGFYNITVEAHDSGGVITDEFVSQFEVSDLDADSPDVIDIDFPSVDFT